MSIVLLKVYNVGTYYGQPYFMNIYLFEFFFEKYVGSKKVIVYPHICWIFCAQGCGGCMCTY